MDGAKSKFVRGIRTGGHLLGGKWQNMEFVIYGICKLKNEHFHFGDPKGRLPLKPCPVSLDAQFFSGSYGGMVAAAVCILDPQGHRFRTCVTGFREGARSG